MLRRAANSRETSPGEKPSGCHRRESRQAAIEEKASREVAGAEIRDDGGSGAERRVERVQLAKLGNLVDAQDEGTEPELRRGHEIGHGLALCAGWLWTTAVRTL